MTGFLVYGVPKGIRPYPPVTSNLKNIKYLIRYLNLRVRLYQAYRESQLSMFIIFQ